MAAAFAGGGFRGAARCGAAGDSGRPCGAFFPPGYARLSGAGAGIGRGRNAAFRRAGAGLPALCRIGVPLLRRGGLRRSGGAAGIGQYRDADSGLAGRARGRFLHRRSDRSRFARPESDHDGTGADVPVGYVGGILRGVAVLFFRAFLEAAREVEFPGDDRSRGAGGADPADQFGVDLAGAFSAGGAAGTAVAAQAGAGGGFTGGVRRDPVPAHGAQRGARRGLLHRHQHRRDVPPERRDAARQGQRHRLRSGKTEDSGRTGPGVRGQGALPG